MRHQTRYKNICVMALAAAICATGAVAGSFDVPGGDLNAALNAYAKQSGLQLIYSGEAVKNVQTRGAKGDLSADDALARILAGTGFIGRRDESGGVVVRREQSSRDQYESSPLMQIAQATPVNKGAVETVTVTSSKIGGETCNPSRSRSRR